MRRVFTHLTSRWQATPLIHCAKRFFLENPDCPTLVEMSKQVEEEQKVSAPSTPQ
jgi:hypothetical protein